MQLEKGADSSFTPFGLVSFACPRMGSHSSATATWLPCFHKRYLNQEWCNNCLFVYLAPLLVGLHVMLQLFALFLATIVTPPCGCLDVPKPSLIRPHHYHTIRPHTTSPTTTFLTHTTCSLISSKTRLWIFCVSLVSSEPSLLWIHRLWTP